MSKIRDRVLRIWLSKRFAFIVLFSIIGVNLILAVIELVTGEPFDGAMRFNVCMIAGAAVAAKKIDEKESKS